MENFNVNLTVQDCCFNKCHSNNISTTKIFTNTNDFIPIQCGYYLRILAIHHTYIVLSIDNTIIHFIRKAFAGIPIRICIPNDCSSHTVTILVNSIAL